MQQTVPSPDSPDPAIRVDRLSRLVAEANRDTPIEFQAIASLAHNLCESIMPSGVLYATKEQARIRRQITTQISRMRRHLRDYYYERDRHHVNELLSTARTACLLASQLETIQAQREWTTPEGEILGDLLIVGWW